VLDTCILVHFTEEVLAIDEMQRPTEETHERKGFEGKKLICRSCHTCDYLIRTETASVLETLIYSSKRPWPRHDIVHLIEVKHWRVVEVNGVLVSEKRTE